METFYLLFSHLITHTTYTLHSTYSKRLKEEIEEEEEEEKNPRWNQGSKLSKN